MEVLCHTHSGDLQKGLWEVVMSGSPDAFFEAVRAVAASEA